MSIMFNGNSPKSPTRKHLKALHDTNIESNGVFQCSCNTCKKQTLHSFGIIKIRQELKEHNIKKVKRQELNSLRNKIHSTIENLPMSVELSESTINHYRWRDMDF
jgi:hypothetical protein